MQFGLCRKGSNFRSYGSAKSCVPTGSSFRSKDADLHEHEVGGVIARASCRGVDGEAQGGGLVDSDGSAAGADCQPSRGAHCVDDLGCVASLQARRRWVCRQGTTSHAAAQQAGEGGAGELHPRRHCPALKEAHDEQVQMLWLE